MFMDQVRKAAYCTRLEASTGGQMLDHVLIASESFRKGPLKCKERIGALADHREMIEIQVLLHQVSGIRDIGEGVGA